MDALYIVTAYVEIDDSLKALGYRDDRRVHVTAAEILTVGVVAARYFQNHLERAVQVLVALGYVRPISVSRFNRRWQALLGWLRRLMEHLRRGLPPRRPCLMDTFPLPVCKRVRQRRCRKVQGKQFLGWCEAKHEWFFGYKLHWCCDAAGVPIAFSLRPARRHERVAVAQLLTHLPPGTSVVADGAYLSRQRAAAWRQRGIHFIAKHHKRMAPNSPEDQRLLAHRSTIETVHSQLEAMGLQRLRARTRIGFCLKVMCSLLALIILHLMPN